MAPTFVTPEDFAEWLHNHDLATEEPTKELVEEVVAAAIEIVQAHVGPLEPAEGETDLTVTYTVYPTGRHLVLPTTRLTGTVQVSDPDGVEVTPRDVNMLAGVIELPYAPRASRPWSVRSTSSEHADAVRLAVKIIAAHLWQVQRRRPSGVPRTEAGDSGAPVGFAIPRRAAELLAPFTPVVLG